MSTPPGDHRLSAEAHNAKAHAREALGPSRDAAETEREAAAQEGKTIVMGPLAVAVFTAPRCPACGGTTDCGCCANGDPGCTTDRPCGACAGMFPLMAPRVTRFRGAL